MENIKPSYYIYIYIYQGVKGLMAAEEDTKSHFVFFPLILKDVSLPMVNGPKMMLTYWLSTHILLVVDALIDYLDIEGPGNTC